MQARYMPNFCFLIDMAILSGYIIPEPDLQLSDEYRLVEQRIGDVGIITPDGGFDFLFNICHSRDSLINRRGVPDNFHPIDLSTLEVREISPFHNVKTHIATDAVHKFDIEAQLGVPDAVPLPATAAIGFEFRVSSAEGAILMLPEGASRTDLVNKVMFARACAKHGMAWLHYATEVRGRMIPDDSLYLVTGCDKTRSWGVAAFSDISRSGGVDLKLLAAGASGVGGSVAYSWHKPNSVAARSGPHSSDSGFSMSNQCVFLRGFRITGRRRIFSKPKVKISLVEESKPEGINMMPRTKMSSPRFSGGDWAMDRASSPTPSHSLDDVDIQDAFDIPESYHPLNAVNSYILDHANCDLVITHDDLWASVIDDRRIISLLGFFQTFVFSPLEVSPSSNP
ncbi:hypothetical protein C8J56DRAFT_482928 [Mycena floridula]|nr:hypothetical protein C8J56DRAFT_482928 [Mycena floridula]